MSEEGILLGRGGSRDFTRRLRIWENGRLFPQTTYSDQIRRGRYGSSGRILLAFFHEAIDRYCT